jgi:predicted nucleic acid-binding protein
LRNGGEVAVYFLDSSALIKRYVCEPGSSHVLQLVDPTINLVVVAAITGVEVVSALMRQTRSGDISPADLAVALSTFRSDFASEYQIIEMGSPVIERAMQLAEIHALRGYDAVQLAAALAIHRERLAAEQPPLTFVSADAALNGAATAEGLPVDNPNDHP